MNLLPKDLFWYIGTVVSLQTGCFIWKRSYNASNQCDIIDLWIDTLKERGEKYHLAVKKLFISFFMLQKFQNTMCFSYRNSWQSL